MIGILGAVAAAVTSAPLPQYRVNDAFVFSNGRVERVREIQGDLVTWSGLTGDTYQRRQNIVVPVITWRSGRGSGTRTIRGNPDLLWPVAPAVQRSVRFRVVTQTRINPMAKTRRNVSLWSCRTKKAKRTTVKAGSFMTIPFLCDRYSATTMRLLERLEWEYAPDIGHYLKRSSINYLRGTKRSVELVAMLSGPSATPARLRALSQAARR